MANPYETTPGAGERAADVADNAATKAADVKDHAANQAADVKDHAVSQAADVKDHAVSQAVDVKDHAVSQAADVVDTAKTEVGAVLDEAKQHGRRLYTETLSELGMQARQGQSKLAELVRDLTGELEQMVNAGDPKGPVTQFAGTVHEVGDRAATWLESSGPDQLMRDVRRFAAGNPVGFLAAAAGFGLVGGRLARALRSDAAPNVQRQQVRTDVSRAFDADLVATDEGMADHGEFGTQVHDGRSVGTAGYDPLRGQAAGRDSLGTTDVYRTEGDVR